MTINEFRSNTVYSQGLRELLSNPVLQEAIMTLKDHNVPHEIEVDDADAIASVRRFSRLAGWNNALVALLSLATSPPVSEPEEPADYGVINE